MLCLYIDSFYKIKWDVKCVKFLRHSSRHLIDISEMQVLTSLLHVPCFLYPDVYDSVIHKFVQTLCESLLSYSSGIRDMSHPKRNKGENWNDSIHVQWDVILMKIAKNRPHSMKEYISLVSQYTIAHKYPCGLLQLSQQLVDKNIFCVSSIWWEPYYSQCLKRCKGQEDLIPYLMWLEQERIPGELCWYTDNGNAGALRLDRQAHPDL